MITSTILAALATGEPVAPGQSPIPVVIIQQEHEGMTTGEWWVTVSAFVLSGVTLLTMIHIDVVLHHLVKIVKTISPARRSTLRAGREPSGTDVTNAPAAQVNKIMTDRSA